MSQTIQRSAIFFGLHRGGSSITSHLLRLTMGAAGYRLVDEGERYYQAGYETHDIPQSFFESLQPEGDFYGPFREYPLTMRLADLSALNRVVVVRDPRDCLVSAYFAQHGPHDRGDLRGVTERLATQLDSDESIDSFCIRNADDFRWRIDSLRQLCLHYPGTLIFRYEDIFNDPGGWLIALLARLGVDAPQRALDQARTEACMLSGAEDPSRHHRQGRPGDHHRKLTRATCVFLAEHFATQLIFFGYHGGPSQGTAQNAVPIALDEGLRAEIAALKRIIGELQTENGYRIREIASLRGRVLSLETKAAELASQFREPAVDLASNPTLEARPQ